jgi:hypothetical protein
MWSCSSPTFRLQPLRTSRRAITRRRDAHSSGKRPGSIRALTNGSDASRPTTDVISTPAHVAHRPRRHQRARRATGSGVQRAAIQASSTPPTLTHPPHDDTASAVRPRKDRRIDRSLGASPPMADAEHAPALGGVVRARIRASGLGPRSVARTGMADSASTTVCRVADGACGRVAPPAPHPSQIARLA